MNINELVAIAYSSAKEKGFYPEGTNIGELLMGIASELGEALEAHRGGKKADLKSYDDSLFSLFLPFFKTESKKTLKSFFFKRFIKGSFEDELADVALRLCSLCGYLDIDLERYIMIKLEYNKTREYKHGKKY